MRYLVTAEKGFMRTTKTADWISFLLQKYRAVRCNISTKKILRIASWRKKKHSVSLSLSEV